ncbi:prepilin-type N-terminal cleavage/methylation domain-containing protein [Thiomicrorhabdus aquaedulcis]|uniref:prepilin-type N-terminal cleavage/methylation domain-containing protein n=1 Tax=Thiomicrorhabdus aquaedulcis TaxID=2211106 RepID=UPI000FD8DBBE|nr:prepilin-type N-terminal cleavage/methylation domain-containing protein [Thiomicrorhabdus aquaedulcis]
MTNTNVTNQKGFTLVEIAIVLVIIGLLLGGVLKGQELITNSKIKSVTADFEGISAAYWAYRDRTGSYPGTTAGNFFVDLRTEGFIGGNAVSTNVSGPKHALDGEFSYVASATAPAITGKQVCASDIPFDIANNIDTKLDDGVGSTGSIRTSDGLAYVSTTATVTLCKELM